MSTLAQSKHHHPGPPVLPLIEESINDPMYEHYLPPEQFQPSSPHNDTRWVQTKFHINDKGFHYGIKPHKLLYET